MITIQAETREELLKQVQEMFTRDELDGGRCERVRRFMDPLMVCASAYDVQRIRDVKLNTVHIPDLWDWLQKLGDLAGRVR